MLEAFAPIDKIFDYLLALSWSDVERWLIFAVFLGGYYALVWHFYHLLSRRDTFHRKFMRYGSGMQGVFARIMFFGLKIIKYGVMFPIVSFFWFAGFSILLFIAAPNSTINQILFLAIGFISAGRLLAYYNERIAEEFVQTLPIIILCIFLVQPESFSADFVVTRAYELPNLGPALLQYVLFLSALEMTLRLFFNLKENMRTHAHHAMGIENDSHETESAKRERVEAKPVARDSKG